MVRQMVWSDKPPFKASDYSFTGFGLWLSLLNKRIGARKWYQHLKTKNKNEGRRGKKINSRWKKAKNEIKALLACPNPFCLSSVSILMTFTCPLYCPSFPCPINKAQRIHYRWTKRYLLHDLNEIKKKFFL